MTLLDFGRTELGVGAAQAAIGAERASLVRAKVELVQRARERLPGLGRGTSDLAARGARRRRRRRPNRIGARADRRRRAARDGRDAVRLRRTTRAPTAEPGGSCGRGCARGARRRSCRASSRSAPYPISTCWSPSRYRPAPEDREGSERFRRLDAERAPPLARGRALGRESRRTETDPGARRRDWNWACKAKTPRSFPFTERR